MKKIVDLSAISNFKSGLPAIAAYAWVLWIFVPIAVIIFVAVMIKTLNQKKKQWTHTLLVQRVLNTGLLSKEIKIRMKRFPLIKTAAVFETEKPFLGSYLIPELDSYTGLNEFSVIIDSNNRILTNKGSTFNPESHYINVSAKHAGIDLAFDDLKSDWQAITKTNKKVDLLQIAKFALAGLLIIAVMVVMIKGIGQWGENHKADTERAQAEAETMRQLAEAMETSQATMNTAVLALDAFKEIYGTNNIQSILKEKLNETV